MIAKTLAMDATEEFYVNLDESPAQGVSHAKYRIHGFAVMSKQKVK